MAQPKTEWVSLGPLKGQNSTDNPLSLGQGWATDTNNIVIDPPTSLASKRKGSDNFGTSGFPTGLYLITHGPAAVLGTEILYGFGLNAGNYTLHVTLTGVGWTNIASWPVTARCVRALYFDNKLFCAVFSSTGDNRMLVVDGSTVRYVGLTVSVAPTVANTGAGAYPATARSYKVDWIYLNPATGVIDSRSELSPAVSFTPSGAGAAARVTKPATLEHATHWRVWGSADGVIYRQISGNIVVATTTYDDSVLPAAYSGVFPEEVGTFLPPPATTRILTDGHRLIFAGMGVAAGTVTATGETPPSATRVWYTPVLGSLDQGDVERVPNTSSQKNIFDIGDPPGNVITELAGPCDGSIFVFTKKQPWRLSGTGDVTTPYLAYPVTSVYGAGIEQYETPLAAALGETESGQPTVYFSDTSVGLYRIGVSGDVQFVSYDIQDEIQGLIQSMNADPVVFTWPDAKQTWWILNVGQSGLPIETPQIRIYVFHWKIGRTDETGRVRGGWTRWTMAERGAACGWVELHNRLPGTGTPYALTKLPYLLQNASAIYRFGYEAGSDGGTPYAATVEAAPILFTQGTEQFRVMPPTIVATAITGRNLRLTSTRDFGTESRSADVSLGPDGTETRVVRTVEGLIQGDVTSFQVTFGDGEANDDLWQIDYLTVPLARQQSR